MAASAARRVADLITVPDNTRNTIIKAFCSDDATSDKSGAVPSLIQACREVMEKCPETLSSQDIDYTLCELIVAIWGDANWRAAWHPGVLSDRCPVREILKGARHSLQYGKEDSDGRYFKNFGRLSLHATMLQDTTRTSTYRKAILQNRPDFEGKVVMDVGSGTGILAFFALQAGAAKVYCVEAATCMAIVIRQLAEKNGYADKVVVVNKVLQQIRDEVPEQVDCILHETLGTFLFAERGIETVIAARQRFLKPGGKLFPSAADFCLSPFEDGKEYSTRLVKAKNVWTSTDFHGVDFSSVHENSKQEVFSRPLNDQFHPNVLRAEPFVQRYDFRTMRSEELVNFEVPYSFRSKSTCILHGLAGWFEVHFEGSSCNVMLSTSPWDVLTHWWQTRLMLLEPLAVNEGQEVTGSLGFTALNNYTNTYECRLVLESGGIRREQGGFNLADGDGSRRAPAHKVQEVSPQHKVHVVDWEATHAPDSGEKVLVSDPFKEAKLAAARSQTAVSAAPPASATATTTTRRASATNGVAASVERPFGSQVKVGGRNFVAVHDPDRSAGLMAMPLVVVAALGQAMLMAPTKEAPWDCLVELSTAGGGAVNSRCWLELSKGLEHMRIFLMEQQAASPDSASGKEIADLDVGALSNRYATAKSNGLKAAAFALVDQARA